METKHSLIVTTTADPLQMLNQYLAGNLRRHWEEEFVDNETGAISHVDRYETIFNRGHLIDNETLSKISFFLQSGDITAVKVSNQQRKAELKQVSFLSAWMVSILLAGKKRKFILYARSLGEAINITQDYVELNYEGMFEFVTAKSYNLAIIVNNVNVDPDRESNIVLYLIDAQIFINKEINFTGPFLVWGNDVDDVKAKILRSTIDRLNEQNRQAGKEAQNEDIDIVILSAKIEACDRVIDKEFSMAYHTDQE